MKKFVLNFSRKHPTLYGWVYLLLFMIFLTVILFFAASSVGCFPDKQKTAVKLSAAACMMMAVTVILSLVIKDGMFSDFCALPQGTLLKAVLSAVLTIAAGTAIILILDRFEKRKK